MMGRIRLVWVLPALILLGGLGALLVPRHGGVADPAFAGTALHGNPAPNFALRDQFGQSTTLHEFRGRPLLVTFMQAHCTDLCPVTAEMIRQALVDLGRDGRRVGVVAISADPEHDTPAAVRWFSWKHRMLRHWQYLTGSRQQLAPVWKHYGVYVPPPDAPLAIRNIHTSATYLIDDRGREQALMTNDLNVPALTHDLRILLGLGPAGSGVSTQTAPEAKHPAPELDLATVGGPPLVLGAMRGRVVLLNFWATWCVPCRTEMPLLERTYQRLKRRGLIVVGVDKQEPRAAVSLFLRTLHITYPVMLDSSGDASLQYQVSALPTSFVIDRQGIIRAVRIGMVDDRYITAHVLPLLR